MNPLQPIRDVMNRDSVVDVYKFWQQRGRLWLKHSLLLEAKYRDIYSKARRAKTFAFDLHHAMLCGTPLGWYNKEFGQD